MLDDKDERIRLLEYQVEFLRRELTFVTRRYEGLIHSAAWTLARPVKRIEDLLHRAVAGLRRRRRPVLPVSSATAVEDGGETLAERIASRIARRMAQPPAGQ